MNPHGRMGITAGPTYITDHGFVISPLYLSINNIRLNFVGNGSYQCICNVQGFKSKEDKVAGRQPINIPHYLALMDTVTTSDQLTNIFDFAYKIIKARWSAAGYQVDNVYDLGQPGYTPPPQIVPTESIQTIVQPVVESVIAPVVESTVVEPVAESVVEPVAESVVESVVEPVAESVAEPVVEPVAEPVVEPAAEPVAESVAEPVAEPTTENTSS
jgi:hypothetical protein